MKKLFLIILVLLFFVFAGCEDKENTIFRGDVMDLLNRLSLHDEDIDDLSYGEKLYEGKANLIIYEEDYSEINLIKAEKGAAFIVLVDVGERSLNYSNINYVDIDYINYDKNLRITLSFYKTSLFSGDFKTEKVNLPIEDFKNGLARLSLDDWEYILKELGY